MAKKPINIPVNLNTPEGAAFASAALKAGKVTVKQARHSQFQRGSGTYACTSCGHQTRDTGDNGQCKLCPICYELAGIDNYLSDEKNLGSYFDEAARLMNQLAVQVGSRTKADSCFEAIAVALSGQQSVPPSPLSSATEEGVGSGGTGEPAAEPADEEGEGSYFVWVKGIPDDPDYVLIVDSTSSYQARRVAKRMVAKHMSLEGLTFSAARA